MGNGFEPVYRRMLREEFAKRSDRNPRYSLRAFARALRMDSGALSQILAGTRVPSEKVAKKLIDCLDLSPDERKGFIRSLAHTHQSRGLRRLSQFFRKLSAEPSNAGTASIQYRDLSIDLFRTIADWHHYAILELTLTRSFVSDPRWIASELGLGLAETKLAITRLKDLGYLEERKGRLVKSTPPLITADRHLTTSAHRKRQRQILEKATTALEEVPIELRNHSAMTMAIDPTRIPEAKKKIQKFLDELTEFLESGDRTQVYEASVCLFPLQKQGRKNS